MYDSGVRLELYSGMVHAAKQAWADGPTGGRERATTNRSRSSPVLGFQTLHRAAQKL